MATFILSDGHSCNSHGFSIDIEGMNTERFKKNPVMLYNHDPEKVIGCWKNLRIEEGRLMADTDIDTEDAIGKEIARKVDKGYLKGCSVGIYIKNMVESDKGMVATETELLEASIVAVPSDANAVNLYDEEINPTTIEDMKLKYKLNGGKKMEKTELTAATITALGIEGSVTAQAIELAVAGKNSRIAELEAEVAKAKKQQVTELIDRAIAEKKIGADEKETYLSLADKDFEGVSKILAKMKSVSPVAAQLNAQAAASKYEGKTWDELDRAGMLASLKAEAPEKYAELYKQKFNV
ncbi:MAG TPA: HK97 family phage prohead protease [Paludibacteraceae bacterium]|mgnify:FL=1|nr:HK97 family phage prohead protease [Paludibacteraceae bacterium]